MSESIHDEEPSEEISGGDSPFVLPRPPADLSVLKVYQTGEVTVVGFEGQDVPSDLCVAGYRTQLLDLIAQHNCKLIAFDLTGVKLLPSGMLGLLASIRQRVTHVEMYNCSADVIEVLQITHFDRLVKIKEVAA